jgi:CRISPR-associated protein Cas2
VEVLVAYDVATDTPAGRRRLRLVAKVCEGFGQRVQKSVFECVISEGDLARMQTRLVRIIDRTADSLRIYRLREPRDQYLVVLGHSVDHDIHDPLIL